MLSKINNSIDSGINAIGNAWQAACDAIENFIVQKIAAPMFTDSNVFHALNGSRLQAEKEQNRNLGILGKITKGIAVGARAYIPAGLVAGIGAVISNQYFGLPLYSPPKVSMHSISWTKALVTAPVREEIIFRGLIQNGIGYAQNALNRVLPDGLKNNCLVRWIASPSARIFAASSLFALAHYGVTYLPPAANMGQMAAITLVPFLSLLYETTGSLLATIPAHAAFNAIGKSLADTIHG